MNLSNKQLKPNPDVIFTIVDDQAILLEQKTGKYYSLNTVGTRFWALLEEYGHLDKVQKQLMAEFDVEEEQLNADVERLVSKLLENDLLT